MVCPIIINKRKEIKTSKISHNNMFAQYKRSWIHRISYTKVQLIWKDVYSTSFYSLWDSNILSSSNFFPGTANYRGGSGSSPDSTGAAEDTLTGCCVSTPSSEALDQVSDLRHSRTLPKRAGIISNENVSSNGLKVNSNLLEDAIQSIW